MTPRIETMLATMAAMQDAHNTHVHAEWRRQGYPYYRAVWVECAELLDHFGWKWWKRQDADLDQVRLEIVDIWHFGLSDLIRSGELGASGAAAGLIERLASVKPQGGDLRAAVELLASKSLARDGFSIEAFFAVMNALPMTFDELFELYIGKNVLNNFRQAHGYKEGRYVKRWDGREDNEHLVALARALDTAAPDYAERLYEALETRYAQMAEDR